VLEEWNVTPSFGLLAADFTEDKGELDIVDKSIEETEELAAELNRRYGSRYSVKNYAHLINEAVENSNFIVPIDGIIGNFIYRTLLYLGGATEYGSPVLIEENIIDNSRYNDRFSTHIIMAAARANGKG
jgi:predicted methyltransferase MtxX (methanogen marker protein 4)